MKIQKKVIFYRAMTEQRNDRIIQKFFDLDLSMIGMQLNLLFIKFLVQKSFMKLQTSRDIDYF